MSGISKLAKTAETGLRESIIYKHNFRDYEKISVKNE